LGRGTALGTGHLELALTARDTKRSAAIFAAEILVLLVTKLINRHTALVDENKQFCLDRTPVTQKLQILFLSGCDIAGKHAPETEQCRQIRQIHYPYRLFTDNIAD